MSSRRRLHRERMGKPTQRSAARPPARNQGSKSSRGNRSGDKKGGGKGSNMSFIVGSCVVVVLVALAFWSALPRSAEEPSNAETVSPPSGKRKERQPQRHQQQQQQQGEDDIVEQLQRTSREQESDGNDQPLNVQSPAKDGSQSPGTRSQTGVGGETNKAREALIREEKEWKPTVLNALKMSSSFEVAGRRIYPKAVKIKLSERKRTTHVKMYTMDHILTDAECGGLIQAHDRFVKAMTEPIFCFDSEKTLQQHLNEHKQLKKLKLADADFTEGTTCLNTSMSAVLNKYIKYSVSTAFYTGESKFSHEMDKRIEEATGLPPHHGGKYQVTSYGTGVGYKTHTDCVVGSNEPRDRFATILVYLNDVPEGGHTIFPDLGVSIEPRRSRSLVWNSMSPEGKCDGTSVHNASRVVSGRKVILQRWYYHHTFLSLGKRFEPPHLPKRGPNQPFISCDRFDQGSCRMYDEWQYHHIKEYIRQHMTK